jgi:hypothetical protein
LLTGRRFTFGRMRTMFAIYLIGIAAGLGFYIVVGLTHH